MDSVEGRERDGADQREVGFAESLFRVIDSVGAGGGNKAENNFKWIFVKISHFG